MSLPRNATGLPSTITAVVMRAGRGPLNIEPRSTTVSPAFSERPSRLHTSSVARSAVTRFPSEASISIRTGPACPREEKTIRPATSTGVVSTTGTEPPFGISSWIPAGVPAEVVWAAPPAGLAAAQRQVPTTSHAARRPR